MAKRRKQNSDDDFNLDDDPDAPDVVASPTPSEKPDPIELGKSYLATLGVNIDVNQIVPTLNLHLGTLRRVEKEIADMAPFLPASGCPYGAQLSIQKVIQGLREVNDNLSLAVSESIREDLARMAKK